MTKYMTSEEVREYALDIAKRIRARKARRVKDVTAKEIIRRIEARKKLINNRKSDEEENK